MRDDLKSENFCCEWLGRSAAGHWLGATVFVLLRRARRPLLVYTSPCRNHGNTYGGGRRERERGPGLWALFGSWGVYVYETRISECTRISSAKKHSCGFGFTRSVDLSNVRAPLKKKPTSYPLSYPLSAVYNNLRLSGNWRVWGREI